jgi:hypothetical protein
MFQRDRGNAMNQQQRTRSSTRVIYPPLPTDPAIFPSIFSLEIREELEVEWQWTHFPDGNGVVTGYRLFLREDFQPASEECQT